MPLTDRECRAAKSTGKIQKLSDGGGLYLWVAPHGNSKLWRVAYRSNGKPQTLSLGKFSDVSLAKARELHHAARALIAEGTDPVEHRRLARRAPKEEVCTFKTISEEYLALQQRCARAPATISKLEWLIGLANVELGALPISAIRPKDVLPVLRGFERVGHLETAKRVRSVISRVFKLAVATDRAELDPAGPLVRAIATRPAKHRAAIINPADFAAFLCAIDGFQGHQTVKRALQLMALLFPRPGELRLAKWPEFDCAAAVWTIPAERTKMRRAHRVPLSRQALELLHDLRRLTGNGAQGFLLPSVRTTRRPISENTTNVALRRLGYGKDIATSHGFRASAATLLNECGKWHSDAIERQLAHMDGNSVRRAYTRGQYWEERVEMMQWWSDYLDQLKTMSNIANAQKTSDLDASVRLQPTIPTLIPTPAEPGG